MFGPDQDDFDPTICALVKSATESKRASLGHEKFEWYMRANAEAFKLMGEQLKSQALKVGDVAPDFELIDSNGNAVSLYAKLKKRYAIVLQFFRSGECVQCSASMKRVEV